MSFEKARFEKANFESATFGDYNLFFETTFAYIANFKHAIFGDDCSFGRTKFGLQANFSNASFGLNISFVDARFAGSALFIECQFGQGAGFAAYQSGGEDESWNSMKWTSFAGSEFLRSDPEKGLSPSFSNRHFLGTTSFKNTVFQDAPNFHNTSLNQDTSFDGADFQRTEGFDAARAYRTLKRAMADAHSRIDAANFYALEMKSLRHEPETKFSVKAMSLAYELASDYGRSFVRPIFWLFYSLLLFLAIFQTSSAIHEIEFEGRSLLGFGIEQIVRPFGVWPLNYEKALQGVGWVAELLDAAPLLTRFLATLQSLISIGLVTLFVLAVRRRFRMD